MASVALLYPLQWVHSFYPLIPTKVLEVLGCPVPFVAGIHACNLEAALEHLNSGTCLVDLDAGRIRLFHSPGQADPEPFVSFATPKAVYHFLHTELSRVQIQPSSALSATKSPAPDWKLVDGEACSFFENLTQPFFLLLANLLGCYSDCVIQLLGSPEVDIDALIAYQNCPELEPFLRLLCESQCVRLFFDSRIHHPPDPCTDAFESICLSLRTSCKRRNKRVNLHTGSPNPPTPAPIAITLNGSTLPRLQAATEATGKYRGHLFTFGSDQWLRSKKIKHPGEKCSWEDATTSAMDNKKFPPTSSSYWTKWSRKFRSHTTTLRNLSSSKDAFSQNDSASQTSLANISISDSQVLDGRRPLTHLSYTHDHSSIDCSASKDGKYPSEPRILRSPAELSRHQQPIATAVGDRKSTKNTRSPASFDVSASSRPKPPRPPPPRTAHNAVSSRSDVALTSFFYFPQPEQDSSNDVLGVMKKARPEFHLSKQMLPTTTNVTTPATILSRPTPSYLSNAVNMGNSMRGGFSEGSSKSTNRPISARNIAPGTPDPLFSMTVDTRAMSSFTVYPPTDNFNRSASVTVASRSRGLRRPMSQLFTQPSLEPVRFTETSQLLLRRLGSLSERSSSIPATLRKVDTADAALATNRKSQSRPSCEFGKSSGQRSDYANLTCIKSRCSTDNQHTTHSTDPGPRNASLPMQPILVTVPPQKRAVSAFNSLSESNLGKLVNGTSFSLDRKSNSVHNLATGDSSLQSNQDMEAKINAVSSSLEVRQKHATSSQYNVTDTISSNRWQWVCTANCHRNVADSLDAPDGEATRPLAQTTMADFHSNFGSDQQNE